MTKQNGGPAGTNVPFSSLISLPVILSFLIGVNLINSRADAPSLSRKILSLSQLLKPTPIVTDELGRKLLSPAYVTASRYRVHFPGVTTVDKTLNLPTCPLGVL